MTVHLTPEEVKAGTFTGEWCPKCEAEGVRIRDGHYMILYSCEESDSMSCLHHGDMTESELQVARKGMSGSLAGEH